MSGVTVYTDYSSKGQRTSFYVGKAAHKHGAEHTYVVRQLSSFERFPLLEYSETKSNLDRR